MKLGAVRIEVGVEVLQDRLLLVKVCALAEWTIVNAETSEVKSITRLNKPPRACLRAPLMSFTALWKGSTRSDKSAPF
eukprot:6881811-Pyramimonas_sp.AAC.1